MLIMSLKDSIRFIFHKHRQKVEDTKKKGWNGLSVFIFSDNAHSEPIQFRINYFIIIFLSVFVFFLPLISLGIYIKRQVDKKEEIESVEMRHRLLELSMRKTQDKRKIISNIEKQLSDFHENFLFQNTELSTSISLENILKTTRSIQEKQNKKAYPSSEPHRSRYELKYLIPMKRVMGELINYRIPFTFRPIWNRITIYHITPRGWGLAGGVGHVTSLYGNRKNPMESGSEFHSGIDFAYKEGTPIIATAPGYIIRAVKLIKSGYGKHVVIHHGFGFTSLYAHCKEVTVDEGDFVERGDIIALLGKTGRTTGHHLHYEIQIGYDKPTNPLPYVKLK